MSLSISIFILPSAVLLVDIVAGRKSRAVAQCFEKISVPNWGGVKSRKISKKVSLNKKLLVLNIATSCNAFARQFIQAKFHTNDNIYQQDEGEVDDFGQTKPRNLQRGKRLLLPFYHMGPTVILNVEYTGPLVISMQHFKKANNFF